MVRRKDEAWKRFWSRVDKGPECWLWDNLSHSGGYGVVQINKRQELAHRVSWEMGHGPIPNGMVICHTCDTRGCVRPSHLFLGTQNDNIQDAVSKKRIWSKLTEHQVKQIRKDTRTIVCIGKAYNIHYSTVSRIKRREIWRHII